MNGKFKINFEPDRNKKKTEPSDEGSVFKSLLFYLLFNYRPDAVFWLPVLNRDMTV